MKITLLCLLGITSLFVSSCESDMPAEPGKPPVSFGNDKFRDESFDRAGAAPVATDREKSVW